MRLVSRNQRVEALLDEECSLLEKSPTGIQGWNCLGPTENASVVIVGQNPYMMSYVKSADGVIQEMSSTDQRALWLSTGLVLRHQGRSKFDREFWTNQFFRTQRWRDLFRSVAIVNAESYRYFIQSKDGKLDIATSLTGRQATLGDARDILELKSLSEQILLATLAMPSVRSAVVAQREVATALQSHPALTRSGTDIKFVGCYHWNHPDVWKDFQTIIDEVGNDSGNAA
jgi:hypothetical protein